MGSINHIHNHDNNSELKQTLSLLNTRIAELSNTKMEEGQRQILDSIRQLFNKSCVIIDQQQTQLSLANDQDLSYELFDFTELINDIVGSLVSRAEKRHIKFHTIAKDDFEVGSVVFAKQVIAEVLSLLLIFAINKRDDFEIRIKTQSQQQHFYKSTILVNIEIEKNLFKQSIISFGELFFSSEVAKYERELLSSCKSKIEQIQGTLGFECGKGSSRFSLRFPCYPYYPLTDFESKEIYQEEVIFVTNSPDRWKDYCTLYESLTIATHYASNLDGLNGLFDEMLINQKKLRLLIVDLYSISENVSETQLLGLSKVAKITPNLFLISKNSYIPPAYESFSEIEIFQQLPNINQLLNAIEKPAKQAKDNKSEITLPYSSILIVDDSKLNREVMKMALRDHDVEIDEAEDGDEALDILKKNSYDLLIVDMRMPNMDGITLVKKIRNELDDHKTPVIGITGDDNNQVKDDFLAAGGSELLVKPVDNRVLVREIFEHAKADVKFYDESQAKLRTNGNIELQTRLKNLLLKEVTTSIETLKSTNNKESIREISHKTVSSTAYCGYLLTSRKAKALEQSIMKKKDPNQITELKHNLIQSLEKTKLHLEENTRQSV